MSEILLEFVVGRKLQIGLNVLLEGSAPTLEVINESIRSGGCRAYAMKIDNTHIGKSGPRQLVREDLLGDHVDTKNLQNPVEEFFNLFE